MTYKDAMNVAAFQSCKVARRNHLWKPGTYVMYHDGQFSGGDITFSAFPMYRIVEGKKVREYKPSLIDLISDDWYVVQERGDKSGKG